jgi:hypothetical protein
MKRSEIRGCISAHETRITLRSIRATLACRPIAAQEYTSWDVKEVANSDITGLFDHLVGTGKKRWGNIQADCPCGL